jgi:Tfp pilus assembly protein PilO
MRLFLPILLVGSAIGLFVLYTNPVYQDIKALTGEVAAYDEALNRSQELRAVRDELLAKRNTFPPAGVQKLERMLPDNVDNIRLIIDINNIAARHNLSLGNVQLGEVTRASGSPSAGAVGASGEAVGSVSVGFSVAANYDSFLRFLADLEHSLRLIDVESLSFSISPEGLPTYSFNIRTYWLQ